MKSFLSCTSYIGTPAGAGEHRIRKWLTYYNENMNSLGVDRLIIIDDASEDLGFLTEATIIDADLPLPEVLPDGLIVFRFSENLGREEQDVFPGWWRSFSFNAVIAQYYQYDKIVFIESDCFVLSNEMMSFMRQLETGWISFVQFQYRNHFSYLRYWNREAPWLQEFKRKLISILRLPQWAESAIHVINEDAFQLLNEIWENGDTYWSKDMYAEIELPYTSIETKFIGGRYAEQGMRPPENADFISQVPNNYSLE